VWCWVACCWPAPQTYFAFAAILLLDHDDAEGSYGVILNRPTEYTLEQLQGIPPLEVRQCSWQCSWPSLDQEVSACLQQLVTKRGERIAGLAATEQWQDAMHECGRLLCGVACQSMLHHHQ
jgi:hypothetical protein